MDIQSIMDTSQTDLKSVLEEIDKAKIETSISELKPKHRQTFWSGLVLVGSSLIISVIFVYFNWCEDDCWDWQYFVLGMLVIAMLSGLMLIGQSSSLTKRLGLLEADVRFLHDLEIALKIAERLPTYIQKEPRTIIRENQGTPTAKEIEKTPDYSFPRQRTQQQIAEGVMSRINK
jgi:hypothetical protein